VKSDPGVIKSQEWNLNKPMVSKCKFTALNKRLNKRLNNSLNKRFTLYTEEFAVKRDLVPLALVLLNR